MDMPTNSPEAQEKCPACGEPNCLDHALRTAPPKAEAQPQEAPDCPHLVVTMYPTKGRFAPPQRYWSCQDCGADFAPSRADLPRTTLAELDVWDRLNERRHELIHLKRQQGFLEERDEMNFNALQWVAGLVRELVAGQPFQINDNSAITARATGETTVEAASICAERKRVRGVLDMLRRGPKTTACWCTGGFHSPPQHSVACKAAHRLYEHVSETVAQVRAATRTEGEGEKS